MTNRKRALIVEDDPIIALDVEAELLDADWDVPGIANNINRAFELMHEHAPLVVLLDINLGQETSFDFARACRQSGIGIVFMSGYASSVLPEDLRDETILRKPIQMSRLIEILSACRAGA
ncbi:response regulator (plasmid) [Roseivivax marinus]|uniref:response regulator n=1 Tax=Roseivivax marinus TaxID=1379903 RepID=UPI001F04B85A|nr:response regulator [Roseivivax marinus]UMA66955.1 response regulator [Roseivivax marinus]